MKQFNKIFVLALALMLVLALCACGQTSQSEGTTPATDPTEAPTQPTTITTEAPTQPTVPEGMVQFKVTVVDEDGNPIVGVMIQVCNEETCLMPVKTDDAGVATFAPAAEGEYHANFLTGVPAGYEAEAEVFYFASGESELTIVLKAVA